MRRTTVLGAGALALGVLAAAGLAVRRVRLEPMLVSGGSMRPTLDPGQRIAVAPLVRPPARGDLVVVARPRSTGDLEVVKRVVGLPGERVRLAGSRSTGRRSPSPTSPAPRPRVSSSWSSARPSTWCSGTTGRPAPTAAISAPSARTPCSAWSASPTGLPGACAVGVRLRRGHDSGVKMLVVVAGGAGFLGASLVDRLQAEGDDVVVVDDLSHGHLANLAEARRRGGVRFHRMDVAQGGLATLADRVRADAWVHLATAIDPVRAWEDPTAEARAVVPGGVEILRAAAATGARAVLASSGAYLYPAQLTGATRAGDVPRPVHPLGASRLAVEAYAGSFAARGLEVATLVLGTVYGPRQDPLGPGLVARAAWTMLQNQAPRVDGDGRQERDFLFVDDAVDAVARAVHASPAPGRVLVGTGTATGVLEVVEQLAARIGWTGEPQWAPARPGDPRRSALDPAAAGKALNWQPWTRLEEGLGLTVDWLKARLPGHHRHIGR